MLPNLFHFINAICLDSGKKKQSTLQQLHRARCKEQERSEMSNDITRSTSDKGVATVSFHNL
jgi:hypothetical protein